MESLQTSNSIADKVSAVVGNFTDWLEGYGKLSRDHQTFFAGPIGGRAKALYYRNRLVGTAAVGPMIFFEAFLPSARQLFFRPVRFPIADAHYAMGFGFLYEATENGAYLQQAIHFLEELKKSRCAGFKEYCWGYPFDWVTRNGVIKEQTPLITTTPYVYEAFLEVHRLVSEDRGQRTEDGGRGAEGRGQRTGGRGRVAGGGGQGTEGRGWRTEDREQKAEGSGRRAEDGGQKTEGRGQGAESGEPKTEDRGQGTESRGQRMELREILESIVRHATTDIKDFKFSETASSCSYTPDDEGGVVNASAYRAFMLTSAAKLFGNEQLLKIAGRNVNFVLESQNADGSWPYARDGVRNFVDHFHTCFVMKALAKIHALTGERRILEALRRGVDYYLENLFAEDGLPRPFSKAPRLTVYKRELYDCAECVNLCLLLRDRFPELNATLEKTVTGVLRDWIKEDGSFRSRRLMLGWDNVPMHRWAQSQMFRSLAFYLRETTSRGRKAEGGSQRTEGRRRKTETELAR
jgi:hypothetical protein